MIVFGGIYAGVFSPTEAAGAACGYMLGLLIVTYVPELSLWLVHLIG